MRKLEGVSWDKPSYYNFSLNQLRQRAEEAYEGYRNCKICPWNCSVDRFSGKKKGVCRSGASPMVSSYNLHFGEEPPISGKRGSGTIFFTNCTLRCVYCQNFPISQLGAGKVYTHQELAGMMLYLQQRGGHNINFVTPTHFVPSILLALSIAVEKGFRLPLVYNTSGYEKVETLRLLDGIVDIYLPDIKYSSDLMAKKYSRAKDYVKYNRQALKEMFRQVGFLKLNREGVAVRGLLIRHLVLPNDIAGSEESLKFIAKELSPDVHISLMSQYFPAYRARSIEELSRPILPEEYEKVLRIMDKLGMKRGWIQEYYLL